MCTYPVNSTQFLSCNSIYFHVYISHPEKREPHCSKQSEVEPQRLRLKAVDSIQQAGILKPNSPKGCYKEKTCG